MASGCILGCILFGGLFLALITIGWWGKYFDPELD